MSANLTKDNARKPLSIPQGLVPATDPRRCGKRRHEHNNARQQDINPILRDGNGTWQDRKSVV